MSTKELIIEDIVNGEGKEVEKGSTITAHYTLWLEDGTMLQTSTNGSPFSTIIGAGRVIQGWDEGIPGMKEGGKRKLTIPPHQAYGDTPPPGIPAAATLTFEVEVLKVG